ncbi:hypothetical protein BC332_08007 [Capsicum chinense]|nr:hypothetical protein BC332_08007 [Capsicum chinense]
MHQWKEEMSRHSDAFIALPVKELQPAIADIGVALGLPTQGSYLKSDHIYSEVMSNIAEPVDESYIGASNEQPVIQETFLDEFKKEQPVIVAHSENTFDGSGIKRLFSNKFKLDKTLDSALKILPRDNQGKISKEYL